MANKVLDAEGFPVRPARREGPILSVRPDAETWKKVRHLKSMWEAERKVNLSLSDVLNALIHQTYARYADAPCLPVEQTHGQCYDCLKIPDGDFAACHKCGRALTRNIDTLAGVEKGACHPLAPAPPPPPPAVKPAPIRPARKKKEK